MVRPTPISVALLLVALASCADPDSTYSVVHHRANGCDDDAPENSVRAARCVVKRCAEGTAPCAFEGDAQLARIRNGSVDGALEVVWMHDGSTARTASCPHELSFPGEAPIDASELTACRLYGPRGALSQEAVPTLDQIIAVVEGTPVTLYLELKASGDETLDRTLAEAAVRKLRPIRSHVIVTSFSTVAIGHVKSIAPEVPTACFAPTGALAHQITRRIAGGIGADVDDCLARGHDFVFVPPEFLDGSIVSHIRAKKRRLGVYGSETADAHGDIQRWGNRIDVVYADHPAMYAKPR